MITESTIPVVGVVLLFLFILLIILTVKMPKVGVWVVGSLVLLAPILLWRLATAGGFAGHEWSIGIPLIGVSATFLFVLLVILLVRAPRVGAGLVVALVVMGVLGLLGVFVAHQSPHQSVAEITWGESSEQIQVVQQTVANDGIAIVDHERVYEGFVTPPAAPPVPSEPLSPIWSEGIEQAFEADIYPSRRAAVRALGRRIARPMREMLADANGPTEIVLFQEEHEQWLVTEFKKGLASLLPEVPCSLAAATRNVKSTEIGVTLRFADLQALPSPWDRSGSSTILTSDVLAIARSQNREATVRQHFVEKPWVEDFSSFVADKPDRHFLIARSWETCTDQNAARHQAMQDASRQLATSYEDLLEGDLVADQFVQSFDGISGPLWRHALLIDAAPGKLAWLNARKNAQMHGERITWARVIVSALGVLVVIVVAYLFLNMATRGYYEWTLRIAGTVLAIAGIIAIFLVLR